MWHALYFTNIKFYKLSNIESLVKCTLISVNLLFLNSTWNMVKPCLTKAAEQKIWHLSVNVFLSKKCAPGLVVYFKLISSLLWSMAIIYEKTIKVNALYYFDCHIMRYGVGWRNCRIYYHNSLVLIKYSSARTCFSNSLCITKFEKFGNSQCLSY